VRQRHARQGADRLRQGAPGTLRCKTCGAVAFTEGGLGSEAWSTRAQDSERPRKTAAGPAFTLPIFTWQNQRAFQKQDCIFVGKKRVLGKAKKGIRDQRYFKSVGLGIKTPRAAIDGTYVDRKCPWTGNVNIRGKLITGVIKTTKMKNTVIIRKDYLHYIKKYNRFEKRHKNTPVHVSPAFRVKAGDEIMAGQCRPLSKTVRFNMLKVIRSSGGNKKGFFGM